MGKPQLVTITEPPTRSPARERLAAAVDRHKSAVELLSRIKTAHELAEETAYVASDKLTAAEAALAEATANEVDHLVSIALGSADVAPSPSKTASDAVERAKNDLSIARATRAALEARQTVTAGEIEKSRYALDDAVKAVLQSPLAGDAHPFVLGASGVVAGEHNESDGRAWTRPLPVVPRGFYSSYREAL